MKIISLNCRVWTRDTKQSSDSFWIKRMKRIRDFLREQNPDILCLQELSFPMNIWIPRKYRRIGLSASHHIYVKRGIKARALWFSIHHNAAKVAGIRIINVHGTWRKCMDRVWEQLKAKMKAPCIVVGDFNHSWSSVAKHLDTPLPKKSDCTFRNYTTGDEGDIDHCVAKGLAGINCVVFDDRFEMSDHLPLIINF